MNFWRFTKRINPLISVLSTMGLMIFGFVMAKTTNFYIFLILLLGWLCIFGKWKACLKILPIAVLLGGIFAAITYYTSDGDKIAAMGMINRFFVLFLSVIPGMSVEPVDLTRSLVQLKVPRAIVLGMLIATSFIPVLKAEIQRIQEAMKTRGAGSVINIKIFYRAFLIPLITRLVNISDTLALSVETRGFSIEDTECSVYKKEIIRISDVIFVSGIISFAVMVVIL